MFTHQHKFITLLLLSLPSQSTCNLHISYKLASFTEIIGKRVKTKFSWIDSRWGKSLLTCASAWAKAAAAFCSSSGVPKSCLKSFSNSCSVSSTSWVPWQADRPSKKKKIVRCYCFTFVVKSRSPLIRLFYFKIPIYNFFQNAKVCKLPTLRVLSVTILDLSV